MVAFARLLEEDLGALEGEAAEDLTHLRAAADEGLELLEALADWVAAARPAREVTPTDLGALFGEVVGALEAERAAVDGTITVHDLPTRPVDPAAFARLATELLTNALRYAGPAPRVTVRAQGDVLLVEDAGPGLDAHQRGRACEPLVRFVAKRRVPGHGLGLAIAERVAAAHDLRLELEQSSGGGLAVGVRWGDEG